MEALLGEIDRVISLYEDLGLTGRLSEEHETDLPEIRDRWQWECEQLAVLIQTARQTGELERWQNSRPARREARKRRSAIDALKARLWDLKTLAPALYRKNRPRGT